jgi:hypothetical protein
MKISVFSWEYEETFKSVHKQIGIGVQFLERVRDFLFSTKFILPSGPTQHTNRYRTLSHEQQEAEEAN